MGSGLQGLSFAAPFNTSAALGWPMTNPPAAPASHGLPQGQAAQHAAQAAAAHQGLMPLGAMGMGAHPGFVGHPAQVRCPGHHALESVLGGRAGGRARRGSHLIVE